VSRNVFFTLDAHEMASFMAVFLPFLWQENCHKDLASAAHRQPLESAMIPNKK
jgi:hypothetical protein